MHVFPDMASNNSTLPPHCNACSLLSCCGGIDGQMVFGGCFSACRDSCDPDKCDYVCPEKWADLCLALAQTGSNDPAAHRGSQDNPGPSLPWFMPQIWHASGRNRPLRAPAVAVPLHRLLRGRRGRSVGLTITCQSELRRRYRLSAETTLVLLGSGLDSAIERLWHHHLSSALPERIAKLGVALVTSPNFSFFLDAPRTHTMYNFRRIAQFSDLLAGHGIKVAPHVNAQTQADWANWTAYFADRPGLAFVAKEFQTGLKDPTVARRHIERIANMEQTLGRSLHFIAIGGPRYAHDLHERFRRYTIISAHPFQKTNHRQRAVLREGVGRCSWISFSTRPDEPLDDLLEHNLTAYSTMLDRRRRSSLPHRRDPRSLLTNGRILDRNGTPYLPAFDPGIMPP